MPIATTIRLNAADRVLCVEFDDGTTSSLPAEYLRVESPSAEVQGHGPGQKRIVPGKRSRDCRVEPVGNYAVRLLFDDRHDTGIYSWDYLYELGAAGAALVRLSRGEGEAGVEPRGRLSAPRPIRLRSIRRSQHHHLVAPAPAAGPPVRARCTRRSARSPAAHVQEDRRTAATLHRRVVPAEYPDDVV